MNWLQRIVFALLPYQEAIGNTLTVIFYILIGWGVWWAFTQVSWAIPS